MLTSNQPNPVPDLPGTGVQDRTQTTGEFAERCLRGHSYLALRNLSCAYRDGVLILSGRLPTYYLKQLAQTAVAQIVGVERIDNQIEVTVPPSAQPHPSLGDPHGHRGVRPRSGALR